jgi:G:T/U-mismatch repair DNA glycosylase
MPKETHPYIEKYFDTTRPWKYLIIGTFPPNKEVREGKKSLTDYFYGNKGSLWKILGKIYTEFDFENGTRKELIEKMKTWQKKYDVGITDTLINVSRRNIASSDDEDLILEHEDYNHDLKKYVLEYDCALEKILFTSSKGCNSSFETFKIIMGADFKNIKAKLVANLPSPSGSSNTAWFNVNNETTLGLHPDFYNFIIEAKQQHLGFFKMRWEEKKRKKETKSKEKLSTSPTGLVTEFKVWSYRKELHKQK